MVMAPMIKKEDGVLDWKRPAVELERRLRAFTPWPGASTRLSGQGLKVAKVSVGQGAGAAGTVLSVGPLGIEVACGAGSLVLLEVQPEGKRVMAVRDFLLGRKIEVGFSFNRPTSP
jgi:methionyl-tRNA formyltransferase